jgi:hypothetical protein
VDFRHNKTPSIADGVFGRLNFQFFSANRANSRNPIYVFETLPLLMQLVHTRMRFGLPFTSAFTACRFTFQRRRVTLCA